MIADVTKARCGGQVQRVARRSDLHGPAASRPDGRRSPRWRAAFVGLVLGLFAGLAGPAMPAAAHAELVGSNPTPNSVVPQAPPQVVLTFTEQVNPIKGKTRVIAPDGSRADLDEVRPSGEQLIIPLKQGGPSGTYVVTFRAISSDSHPVAGSFTYSVGAPSAPPSLDDAGSNSTVTVGMPIARWIGYLGLLLLVGAVFVLALLWPARLPRRGPARLIWLGAGLVALGTIGEVVLQVPYVAGGGLSDLSSSDVREVLSSQFGTAHLVRLGVLGVALLLLRPFVAGRSWSADRVLLAVLGAVGVATWPMSGHPSASPVPAVTVVADMIHLSSMSVWIGGLVMLAAFVLPRASAIELAAIMPVWSRWAAYAVAALILTGVTQALVQVGDVAALTGTTYGRQVMIKVSLVAVVLAVALISRRLVAPIMGGTDGVARRLRTMVLAEAVTAALILAVTSVLVQTTPARSVSASTAESSVQSVVLRDELYVLTADLEPAVVGMNNIHLYATTPDGKPADVKQWRARAALPSQGIEPIDVTVLPVTPDHAIGQVGLPAPGVWTITFTLRLTEVDQATVTTTFTVS